MNEYDVELVLVLLMLACANEIDFGVTEGLRWFPFNFEDIIVYYLSIFEDPRRSTHTHPAVLVHYRGHDNGMVVAFAQVSLD